MLFNFTLRSAILIGACSVIIARPESITAHPHSIPYQASTTQRTTRSCQSGKLIPGEVIVSFADEMRSSEINTVINKLIPQERQTSARKISASLNLYLIRSHGLTADAVRAKMEAMGLRDVITDVEPNLVFCIEQISTDPYFPKQWALRDYTPDVAGISAVSAWDLSRGSDQIVVGIIDTGIDTGHPDLKPNLWKAPLNFTFNFNGRPVPCPGAAGWDAIKHNCNPSESGSHGTLVAGIIGARGGNGIGLHGVNWYTSLMAIKAFNFYGVGAVASVIEALDFAIEAKRLHGINVRVLNNSYGQRCTVYKPCPSRALERVIRLASDNEILFVSSAGEIESQPNNDDYPHYPSSYEIDNIIAVAWTNKRDELSPSSNYGLKSVDLGAPGSDIWSTFPQWYSAQRGYHYANGTSMSAPFVSGTAALVLSRCPNLSTTQLKQLLLESTDPILSLKGKTVTGGRLNAYEAVKRCH